MTTTTDIEALVKELRALSTSTVLPALSPIFTGAADALQSTQAVVEAAREACDIDTMFPLKKLHKALAALDAPDERDG